MVAAQTKMQLSDWLDDLCVRFIINLPQEELMSVERICFQVEEAQWFYEDFIRPQDPELPSLSLKEFCLRIFQHCPLFSEYSSYHHAAAFSEFLAYKERVPVRGAIMLNYDMDEVVLVKGWKKSASWSFPRGKINKDELDLDCAVREVYEETGFNLRDADLVGDIEDTKYIEMTIREQHMRLYIFVGVPIKTEFEPRTRKEISAIQWYKLSELPTLKKQKQHGEDPTHNASRFYMVAPFMVPLRKWISRQKTIRKSKGASQLSSEPAVQNATLSAGNDQSHTNIPHTIIAEEPQTTVDSSESRLISDLPEVSRPIMSLEDTSAQLKSLLGVPPNNILNTPVEVTKKTPATSDSEYLLALLRPKGVQNPPPDPPGSFSTGPRASSSPKLSTPTLSNEIDQSQFNRQPFIREGAGGYQISRQSSPPYPRTDDLQLNIHSSVPHRQNANALVNHFSIPYNQDGILQPNHHDLPPWQRTSDPQLKHHPDPSHQRIGNPQVDHPSLPPYKRTGDPQFASNSQIPEKDAIAIPPANKLPLPTLTTHSSTLLSLFKENKPRKAQPSISPSSTENISKEARSGSRDTRIANEQPEAFFPPSSRIHITKPLSSVKARSEHQDKLLNLFKPSVATVTEPVHNSSKRAPQNLELLSTLAELSALPSPAHSRVHSNADISRLGAESGAKKSPLHAPNPQITTKPPAKNPQVFATVSGPLHFPQFDALAKLSKDSKSALPKDKNLKTNDKSSFKILTRPTPSEAPLEVDKKSISSMVIPSNNVEKKVSQPQAFHTAEQTLALLKEDTISPTTKSLSSPKHFQSVDQQNTQTQDHKKTLLSLFNKTVPPSPSRNLGTIITNVPSPTRHVHQRSSPLLTPLTPRSRLGSVTSVVGEGKVKKNSISQSSGTTSADKDILLGYLNSVARGERR